jgi:hypothetical protein
VLWAVLADELREGMDGAEALIARRLATAPVSLHVLEEPPQQERGQILDL